ncbi:MAG: hypothetical protein KKD74_04735 [Bacteroidetes bacterium]|nr:hypothetical protein [Bacteroidota bacterium]
MSKHIRHSLTLILTLLASYTFSQETLPEQSVFRLNKGRIGLTYASFGENPMVHFRQLVGAASYNSGRFYVLGISYDYPLNDFIRLSAGFDYAKHYLTIVPNVPPGIGDEPYGINFSHIDIPFSLEIGFLRYFFLHGGLLLDIDPNLDSPVDIQSGIGASLGIGARYTSRCGLAIFVSPYLKVHTLFSFSTETYPLHLLESGIQLGLIIPLRIKRQ